MTNHEDELQRRIRDLRFDDEPPMASDPGEDVARGRRRLLRHRLLGTGTGLVGAAAVVSALALINPFAGTASGQPSGIPAAGPGERSGRSEQNPPRHQGRPEAGTTTAPDPGQSEPGSPEPGSPRHDDTDSTAPALPFPKTRARILQVAVEHLDPQHIHLQEKSTGVTGGGGDGNARVGTKLAWRNNGENGTGLVYPIVTTPGYVEHDQHERGILADLIGCPSLTACERITVPGAEGTVWFSPRDPDNGRGPSALYQRSDGSIVALAVFDLFEQNSRTPVSDIDITRDDVIAFVTDPDLRVDAEEAETGVPVSTDSARDSRSG